MGKTITKNKTSVTNQNGRRAEWQLVIFMDFGKCHFEKSLVRLFRPEESEKFIINNTVFPTNPFKELTPEVSKNWRNIEKIDVESRPM